MNWQQATLPLMCLSGSLLGGCGTTDLGTGPEFLWWTDHESGDLADWSKDAAGYTWTAENGTLNVVTIQSRSGRYALAASVVSPGSNESSALASRRGTIPTQAFYSAWFFIPEAIDETSYWLCFKFRSRSSDASTANPVDLWDLNLMPGGATGMRVRLYRHDTGDEPAMAAADVPIQRWFQIEAFFRPAADSSGQLTVWVDGNKLFNIDKQATAPSTFVEWSVGGVTERISPTSATIFIDDAAITTARLGPEFPVFWRK